jgi:aminoglycoside phosphotransferase family enzyme
MRRLAKEGMLNPMLATGSFEQQKLDRLAEALSEFYAHARRIPVSPQAHVRRWRGQLDENLRSLSNPQFGFPATIVAKLDPALRAFVADGADCLRQRAVNRRIDEGHGDLRSEHIYISSSVAIIDCLEFQASFRILDPFDELAFLSLECERMGAAEARRYIVERTAGRLRDNVSPARFIFYRCCRAMMRARLGAAHLLEAWLRAPGRCRQRRKRRRRSDMRGAVGGTHQSVTAA